MRLSGSASIAGCTAVIESRGTARVRLAVAFHNRGVAYFKSGLVDRAVADFDRAVEMNPAYAEAFNDRGVAYGDQQLYDRAIEDFDRAIQLEPNYSDAFVKKSTLNRCINGLEAVQEGTRRRRRQAADHVRRDAQRRSTRRASPSSTRGSRASAGSRRKLREDAALKYAALT